MHEHIDIIQPKDDEQIYAETAAFAHEQPFPHDRQLSKDIGGTATAFVAGETVTTSHEDFMGKVEKREHTPANYVEFLRSMDPETRSDIGFLTDKMQAYEGFRVNVDAALNEATENDAHYLGRGSNGKAFMVEQDGERYAVKTGGVSYADVRAFNRAKDIENVGHLIAMDLDTNRSVMNLVPGTEAPRLTTAQRQQIPQRHIEDVIGKSLELYDAKIQIDPKPSNYLYDSEKGFGIIDYQAQQEGSQDRWTRSDQAMSAHTMLVFHNPSSTDPAYGTPEYAAWQHDNHIESVGMLNKFLDAMEAKYPDTLEAAAARQAAINADPKTFSSGFYPVHDMPTDTPELQAFKERVIRLGLQGQEYHPVTYNFDDGDIIDAPIRVV
jgi:hypothetical protein